MNFYQHHIGDFNNATRHLTRVERALYRDLIELYYDTELPLLTGFESLARRVLARDEEEKAALKLVLDEFFTLESDGYHNKRCDEEIAKYHAHIESKVKAGRASALARQKNSTSVERVLHECATNQEPLTINQEPIKNRAPATRLPTNWIPDYTDARFCADTRPDLKVDEIADSFRDYWVSVPGAKGRKLDWSATWRNWIRNQRQSQTTQKGQTRHEQLASKLADLTGRRPVDTRVIHGTAERLD